MGDMTDEKLLKEICGLDANNYGSWTAYLKNKVRAIRKYGLEAVKMMYVGYDIYDIYSYNGDGKFDVVMLSGRDDGCPQLIVNHYSKEVTPIHGYPWRGMKLARELGYKYISCRT